MSGHLAEILSDTHPGWGELIDLQIQIRDGILDYWLKHDLFSYQWWLLLFSTLAFWFAWVMLKDRRGLSYTVMYGLMVSLAATYLDAIGSGLVLWGYPHMEAPLMYPAAWVNFGPLPVAYMLLYQRFKTWREFIIAVTGVSAIIAYFVEPLEVWLRIYEMYHWRYTYSFVVYTLLFISLRWVVERVKALSVS